MASFMQLEPRVCDLPLSFAKLTTDSTFSNFHLTQFLTAIGVLGMGLWKYECQSGPSIAPWDTVFTPGDDLDRYSSLWTVTGVDEPMQESRLIFCSSKCNPYARLSYEDAMLHAYVLPTESILLSLPPSGDFGVYELPGHLPINESLVSVYLSDWATYYRWRGLVNSNGSRGSSDLAPWDAYTSPVAILHHWPLTMYYIMAFVLPKMSPSTVTSVRQNGTLCIHVIGIEYELSMLPVFKELDHLIDPDLVIRLVFVGLHMDPSVNRRTFHLSPRLSIMAWAGTYDKFVRARWSMEVRPDCIIGFNSGLSAYNTWPPTLQLIHALRIPAFFTDACLYSCAWSFRVVRELGLSAEPDTGDIQQPGDDLLDPTGIRAPLLNPFRSPIRLQSAGVRWGWFRNAFIFAPIRLLPSSDPQGDSMLMQQLASLHV